VRDEWVLAHACPQHTIGKLLKHGGGKGKRMRQRSLADARQSEENDRACACFCHAHEIGLQRIQERLSPYKTCYAFI
jgi:hypothetical protein